MPAHRAPIVVDASTLASDTVTIELLARFQLAARRLGCHLLLRGASVELARLIVFTGLEQVLVVEPRREAEQREQPLGAEEEGQLRDPPA